MALPSMFLTFYTRKAKREQFGTAGGMLASALGLRIERQYFLSGVLS
jgi:hypothetical protein